MYERSYSSFFMGANTPFGFRSLYDGLYFPEDGWRLYILKGGPGTGKSTLMKTAAARADAKGLYSERIYCSSDPSSLDALILPHMKISVCDGTPPHTVEPKYPGVSESLIDLGVFRDDDILAERAGEIISAAKSVSFRHKKCIDFLAAAACVDADTVSSVLPALKTEKLRVFAERLSLTLLGCTASGHGRARKRFLSAPTPDGISIFTGTFDDLSDRKIILEDSFGIASSAILKTVSRSALERGLDCIECFCPLQPDKKLEHLFIPDLSLGFFTSNRFHAYSGTGDKTVNCLRFFDRERLKEHKNRIAFNFKAKRELLAGATAHLSQAREKHAALEALYRPAMDFDALQLFSLSFADKLFG